MARTPKRSRPEPEVSGESDDSYDSSDPLEPVPKKKKAYKKDNYVAKFSAGWLNIPEFKTWLARNPKNLKQPYCNKCLKPLKASNTADLKKHQNSQAHKTIVTEKKNQLSANEAALLSEKAREVQRVKYQTASLEISLSAMTAKHNLPISHMDTLQNVLKKNVPDSKVIQALQCGRTKTTGIIKHVIAPAASKELHDILKKTLFSLIVDETTDRTTTKFLVILVRYYCEKVNEPLEEFFSLPVVEDQTTASLKKLIVEEFEKAQVPMTNIIGFASDNASVMAGKHGGLAALIKKDIPWLNVFGCICHSFALCAAAACDTLDEGIISFAHNVYNFLAFSSKRQNEFKECQDYVEAAKHSILYPSKTRWLVMEQVVKRLLEQWKALNLCFQSFLLSKVISILILLYYHVN